MTQLLSFPLAAGNPAGELLAGQYQLSLDESEFDNLLGIGSESYCRYMWSPRQKDNAWQAIGNRVSGKPTTTIDAFQSQVEGQLSAQDAASLPLDVYISPNQFFDWRNTKQLSSLHANWVEIDTKGHKMLTQQQERQIVTEALAQLQAKNIPLPTAYVHSGSGGVHLYWIYEGVEAYKWRVEGWRAITSKIAKALRGGKLWEVDLSASRDPARVLRKVGSFHGKSKRLVAAFIGGEGYSFDGLAKRLGIEITKPTPLKIVESHPSEVSHAKLKPEPMSDPQPQKGKHTIGQWWGKIYFHILHSLRRKGVPIGQRDSAAFLLFNALRHLKSDEEAFETIKTLNDELIHLTDEELEAYLSTAKKIRYKYKKDSVADYLERQLGIKADFLYKDSPAPLPPEEIKRRQHIAAKVTAHSRSNKTLSRLLDALRSLMETRMLVTQEAIATVAGRSVRTVRRYWEIIKKEAVNSSPSIYSPL